MKKTKLATEPKPIRQAGESLRTRMETYKDDKIMEPLMGGALAVMMLLGAWMVFLVPGYFVQTLLIVSAIVFVHLVHIGVKIRKARKELRNFKKGLLGERLVEEQLDEIRKAGFDVFHDFILKDENCTENIDHIIVGPSGIFTLETKNWSAKGAPQDDRITFDGEILKIGAHTQEEKVLKQPRRQAAKLQAILQPVTQDPLWVVPILCFWDRYVQLTRFNPTGLQVLNQKGISSFILSREKNLQRKPLGKFLRN